MLLGIGMEITEMRVIRFWTKWPVQGHMGELKEPGAFYF